MCIYKYEFGNLRVTYYVLLDSHSNTTKTAVTDGFHS